MTASLLSDPTLSLVHPLVANGDAVSPSAPAAREAWEQVLGQLRQIAALGEDWDGQGAAAPSAANVASATEWVQHMQHYPRAVPPSRAVAGVGGEVYLEWQGEKLYLVAEVCEPGRVEWTLSLLGQPNKHWVTEGGLPYFVGPGR
jgi:hypothetical protein